MEKTIFRSSETGKVVTEEFAKANPSTTEKENFGVENKTTSEVTSSRYPRDGRSEENNGRDARIAELKAEFKKAEDKRRADGVKESKEEAKAREGDEARRLEEAKTKVSEENQLHLDARDTRVKSVKSSIENARLGRIELEKTGFRETEGIKLDRERKEAKDLKEANRLYAIEPILRIETNFGSGDDNLLRDKINEIIKSHCQGK